jgi:uncharacterized membrane protein
MQLRLTAVQKQFLLAMALATSMSLAFFTIRVFSTDTWRYWFLCWNLVLAWLPLMFAWLLQDSLKYRRRWLSGKPLIFTLLWLGFLPNSFYLISDLIHLRSTGEVSLLYDAVMFFSFIFNGLILGYTSVFIVQRQVRHKWGSGDTHAIMAGVLLLCSFAIYLGRNLRLNSWDVLINPAGLLFDVSDQFINPTAHPQVLTTTVMFFALLLGMYTVIWQVIRAVQAERP